MKPSSSSSSTTTSIYLPVLALSVFYFLFIFLSSSLSVVLASGDVDDVVNKIFYSSSTLHGRIQEWVWSDGKTAVVRTDRFVYVTVDAGASWRPQNEFLCGSENCVKRVVVNPADKKTVFMIGTQDEHWITEDIQKQAGKKFRSVLISVDGKAAKIELVRFHPTDTRRALALVRIPNPKISESPQYQVYHTSDLCNTWKKVLSENVLGISWGSNALSSSSSSAYNPDTFYGIRERNADGGLFNPADKKQYFFTYDVRNARVEDTIPDAEAFFANRDFLFVAVRGGASNAQVRLHVSRDNGVSFRPIELNSKAPLISKAFTVLDTSEGAAFLNIFHGEQQPATREPWGTVYSSDSTGSRYSATLSHNRRLESSCDFHKVKSLEGVYVANVIDNAQSDDACKRCTGFNDCINKCRISSRITHDKGAQWMPLHAPTHDMNNRKVQCYKPVPGTDRCPLHLHGFASLGHSPLLAHQDATGLIMASGNHGDFLEPQSTGLTNVYYSRDAGVTWEEVVQGPHHYELSDYGGLMVVVPSKSPTDMLGFSLDEGKTLLWTNFTSPEDHFPIRRLRTSPDQQSMVMLLEAVRDQNSVIIHADFSRVHSRECTGHGSPDQDTSDYESFVPRTYANNKCFLGRTVQYVRRKRDRKCYNPKSMIEQSSGRPLRMVKHCKCTYDDYECDVGYEPTTGDNGKLLCNAKLGSDLNRAPPRNCYTTYNESRGYLRVAGDSCVTTGGLDLDPIKRVCPSGVGMAAVIVFLLFSCVLCAFMGVFAYMNGRLFRRYYYNAKRTIQQSSAASASYRNVAHEDLSVGLDDDVDDIILEEEDATEIDTESLRRNNAINLTAARASAPPPERQFHVENVVARRQSVMAPKEETVQFFQAPEVDESILDEPSSEDENDINMLNNRASSSSSGFNPRANEQQQLDPLTQKGVFDE